MMSSADARHETVSPYTWPGGRMLPSPDRVSPLERDGTSGSSSHDEGPRSPNHSVSRRGEAAATAELVRDDESAAELTAQAAAVAAAEAIAAQAAAGVAREAAETAGRAVEVASAAARKATTKAALVADRASRVAAAEAVRHRQVIEDRTPSAAPRPAVSAAFPVISAGTAPAVGAAGSRGAPASPADAVCTDAAAAGQAVAKIAQAVVAAAALAATAAVEAARLIQGQLNQQANDPARLSVLAEPVVPPRAQAQGALDEPIQRSAPQQGWPADGSLVGRLQPALREKDALFERFFHEAPSPC